MTLMGELSGPAGDLLGMHHLMEGGGAAARMESLRRLQHRFTMPETLRAVLERRHAEGYRAMVVIRRERLLEALGRRAHGLPAPLPLVPDLGKFMREAVEYGMVGAGLRRAWRVDFLSLASLGMRSIGRFSGLKQRDFPTMLHCFVELELADFARYRPPLVFLQPPVTDLAVAMNNPRIIEAFSEAVRNRMGAQAGLATENFVATTAALKSWGLEIAAMIAPWEAGGRHMRPSLDACVQAARATDFPIWANRLGRLDPPDDADRELMARSGLVGAVRDDFSLWCDV